MAQEIEVTVYVRSVRTKTQNGSAFPILVPIAFLFWWSLSSLPTLFKYSSIHLLSQPHCSCLLQSHCTAVLQWRFLPYRVFGPSFISQLNYLHNFFWGEFNVYLPLYYPPTVTRKQSLSLISSDSVSPRTLPLLKSSAPQAVFHLLGGFLCFKETSLSD